MVCKSKFLIKHVEEDWIIKEKLVGCLKDNPAMSKQKNAFLEMPRLFPYV